MAGTHRWQSLEMNFIIQPAKEADQQLKREVRRRKRKDFLGFVNKVDKLSYRDLLRLMSSICRRRQNKPVHLAQDCPLIS